MNKKWLIASLFAIAVGIAGGYFIAYKRFSSPVTLKAASGTCELSVTLRKLWAQQAFLTRNYMLAELNETGDSPIALEQLLLNQEQFGDAFVEYYGQQVGQQISTLFKEHVLIAVDLLAAAKVKSISRLRQLDKQWRTNAQEMVTLLHTINPHLEEKDLKALWKAHLTLTAEEVMARLSKKWKADLKKFEEIFEQSLEIADYLAAGIKIQFP